METDVYLTILGSSLGVIQPWDTPEEIGLLPRGPRLLVLLDLFSESAEVENPVIGQYPLIISDFQACLIHKS